MSDETGQENMPTPEQPKEGLPKTPARPEIKPIAGGAPGLFFEKPEEKDIIENSDLKAELDLKEQMPESMITLERLENWYDDYLTRASKKEISMEETAFILGKIGARHEQLTKRAIEAEPEIKRLERPKTPEEAVNALFNEIFNLHGRGLREGKGWEKTGELYSEYTTIQRWVEDLPPQIKGERHPELSNALKREKPEGVFLKEKMELFLEAMKRLHNREIEVLKAEGGLEDLGVGKVGEAAAPILKVPFTNIRPIDWYVITHVDELFPESSNPENKIDLESAWGTWQEIGRCPYEYDQEDQEWKLKKIKIGAWQSRYALKDLYQSDRVMKEVRTKIAEEVGNKIGNSIAGIRAEALANSILRVGLTFDMWDRERWKQKGKQQVRDLIWFEYKRHLFYRNGRPAGPEDTVGRYWAYEHQDRKDKRTGSLSPEIMARLGKEEAERRVNLLGKNKERAIFVYSPSSPSEGTIIGDFWISNTIVGKNEVPHRLSKYSLKQIPWIEEGEFKFEEEFYEGFFTYQLMKAASIGHNINRLEWKPEDLINRDFWVEMGDLTLRLSHFCPWLIARRTTHEDKPIRTKEERLMEASWYISEFRRILARGILWTGSRLATSKKGLLATGRLSREEVYGSLSQPGILDAIESSGYLGRKNLGELKTEIQEFDFAFRGRGGPLAALTTPSRG